MYAYTQCRVALLVATTTLSTHQPAFLPPSHQLMLDTTQAHPATSSSPAMRPVPHIIITTTTRDVHPAADTQPRPCPLPARLHMATHSSSATEQPLPVTGHPTARHHNQKALPLQQSCPCCTPKNHALTGSLAHTPWQNEPSAALQPCSLAGQRRRSATPAHL